MPRPPSFGRSRALGRLRAQRFGRAEPDASGGERLVDGCGVQSGRRRDPRLLGRRGLVGAREHRVEEVVRGRDRGAEPEVRRDDEHQDGRTEQDGHEARAGRPARGVDAGRDPPDGERDVEDRERGQDARRDDEGEDLDLAAAHVVAQRGDHEQRHRDEEHQRRDAPAEDGVTGSGDEQREQPGGGGPAGRRGRGGGAGGQGAPLCLAGHVTGTGTKVTVWYDPDGLGKVR